jgi:hypothetical protein
MAIDTGPPAIEARAGRLHGPACARQMSVLARAVRAPPSSPWRAAWIRCPIGGRSHDYAVRARRGRPSSLVGDPDRIDARRGSHGLGDFRCAAFGHSISPSAQWQVDDLARGVAACRHVALGGCGRRRSSPLSVLVIACMPLRDPLRELRDASGAPYRRPRPMSARASTVDISSTPRGMGRQQPATWTRVRRWGRPRMKRCLWWCRQ